MPLEEAGPTNGGYINPRPGWARQIRRDVEEFMASGKHAMRFVADGAYPSYTVRGINCNMAIKYKGYPVAVHVRKDVDSPEEGYVYLVRKEPRT